MDRKQLKRAVEQCDGVAQILHNLSFDTDGPEAAYWLSLKKANDAVLAGLDALYSRSLNRAPVNGANVDTRDISAILGGLIDAADTLANEFPFLLTDQVPIEVDVPAFSRRRAGRRQRSPRFIVDRDTIVRNELAQAGRLA